VRGHCFFEAGARGYGQGGQTDQNGASHEAQCEVRKLRYVIVEDSDRANNSSQTAKRSDDAVQELHATQPRELERKRLRSANLGLKLHIMEGRR